MVEEHGHQQARTLEGANRFPPTVVDHVEYDDGYDLELLDPGTEDDPRFIRIWDDQPMERVGFEEASNGGGPHR